MSERKILGWRILSLDFHPMVFAYLSRWIVLTLSLLPWEKVVDSPCLSRVELEFLSRKLSRLLRILSETPPLLRYGRQSGIGVSLGS